MFQEDLSRNFGFLLNDVARLMRLVYDRRVKDLGLSARSGGCLRICSAATAFRKPN